MSTVKTAKGTELPLISLKGKYYLEVKYRIAWFREEHPDWSIETEYVDMGEDHSVAKATIKDTQGKILATAHKKEDAQGFVDFMEKSETGSIGRALALLGYGTVNAQELEEGERIVDAPVVPKPVQAKQKPAQVRAIEAVKIDTGSNKIKAKIKWDKTWPAYASQKHLRDKGCEHPHLRDKNKEGKTDPHFYYCNDCTKGSIPKDAVEIVG